MSGRVLHINHFTTRLVDGGIEERVARIGASLDRQNYSFSWCAFGGDVNERLIARAGPDVKWALIERRRSGVDIGAIMDVAWRLKALGPDIVHVHNWSTSLYAIVGARLAGIDRVIFGLGGRENSARPSARQRVAARSLAPLVDRFTCVCQFLGDELAETWSVEPSRIDVIPTGISLDAASSTSKAQLREELSIPPGARVIGTIAADRPVKRLVDLFEAALAVMKAHPDVFLLWIGADHGSDLRALAERHGLSQRCRFPGRIDHAASYMSVFDVFVNCSDFEGTSNAILEAMAAGCAIIASAVGGSPELIQDAATGLLVPPRSPARLQSAILRILEDDRLAERLRGQARAYSHANHSLDAMNQRYQELYRRVAAEPRRRSPTEHARWAWAWLRASARLGASFLETNSRSAR